MKDFLVIIGVTFVLAYLAEWLRVDKNDINKKLYMGKVNWIFVIALMVFVSWAAYKRPYAFGDTATYLTEFQSLKPQSFKECWKELELGKQRGVHFVISVFKLLGYTQKKEILTIVSVWFYPVTIFFLYKNTKAFDIAMLSYICFGTFVTSMNAMKQYAALIFVFLSIGLIYRKKWYLYFPFIYFVVMLFHRSAMIFFLVYVVCNIDFKKYPKIKKNMPFIILGLGLLLFISYPVTGNIIADLVKDDATFGKYNKMVVDESTSANPLRILTALVPFTLGIIYRDRIEPHEKYYHIFLCMTAFNIVAYGLGTMFVYYARFAIYFQIFSIPILTWVVHYAPFKHKKALYFGLIAFMLTYFYFDATYSKGIVWDFKFFTEHLS